MTTIRMTVVASSVHPSAEVRFYVLWKNGDVCAMAPAQFLNATKGWAYTTERHQCLDHLSPYLPPIGFPLPDRRPAKTPDALEKFAREHHSAALLTPEGLLKPELRCAKCQRWHDTPCEESA